MPTFRKLPLVLLFVGTLYGAVGRSAEPIALAPQDGVLILQNGEVIHGKITQSGNRYYVALPHGELRLRAEDVAVRCKDLQDGYTQKRAALRGTRAEEHLDLAQWCLNHELYDAAETEIRYAATLDDGHPRLRLLARKLELARTTPEKLPAVPAPPTPTTDVAELDRLTKSVPSPVLQRFTTTVQPLLLNTCATTGCHGVAAKSKFTLTRLRGQGERVRRQTLRNYLAVMEQIDAKRPLESPLLTQPIEAHGDAKTAIFTHKNSRQYYELFDWVRLTTGGERPATLAAKPKKPAEGKATKTPPAEDNAVEQVSFEEEIETGAEPEAETPAAVDPFDPEEFNREFGGKE